MGPAIAADDAGTLWTHTMRGDAPGTNADWRVGINTFLYYFCVYYNKSNKYKMEKMLFIPLQYK